ncbi:MAG: chorismate mutase [Candidatus Parcubacteria bacterium]|nr:chorismate mutase [Candidatus Parcubacteria bacterium]
MDKLDKQLLKLLKKRSRLVERVGIIKKKHGIPIFNKLRELEIDKKLDKFAKQHGLRKTFLQKIWKTMIDEAKLIEKKIKR